MWSSEPQSRKSLILYVVEPGRRLLICYIEEAGKIPYTILD